MQLAGTIASFLSFSKSSLHIALALCDIERDADMDGGGYVNWGIPYFAGYPTLTNLKPDRVLQRRKNGPP